MIYDVGEDKRFFGIYRAVVADSGDPENLGRVKLLVPQILGSAATGWAHPIVGSLVTTKAPYAVLTYNGTQAGVVGAENLVIHDTVEDSGGGVYLDVDSHIRVSHTGDYQVIFSAQFSASVAATRFVDIWVRVNNVDIPRSNSRVELNGSGSFVLASVPFILDLKAGDFFELVWSPSGTNVALTTTTGLTSPTRPDIPAVITNVNLIGNYMPSAGTPVWAMFEGGDPNFPLWLGAF